MNRDFPIETADDAGRYLESLINFERARSFAGARMGLEAIEALLARLGNPERSLSVVHVAGSKGKGSTSIFSEALLRALGERVATFSSPHLERWTERFRIDGRDVEGSVLAAAVRRLRPHVEAMRAADGPAPTFFDATTAAAFLLFAEASVDRVVLEVGLGGRLDSTNVVTPAVSCVTSIELEHTEKLGNTVEKIAYEKAGILKPRVPAIVGALPEPALRVVEARARELAAPLYRMGQEFHVQGRARTVPLQGSELRYEEPGGFALDARLAAPGAHQVHNAALAIAAVRRLGAHDDASLATAANTAFASLRIPGRIEVLCEDPWVLVDSAHTERSARALAQTLSTAPARRVHLLLSVSAGKDLAALLSELLPQAALVTVTRADTIRSLDPAEVAAAVRARRPELPVAVVDDPRAAVEGAWRALDGGDLLCVTGSMYLAGVARSVLIPLISGS